MSYTGKCENCGCSTYDNYCVNCDEEVFIDEQDSLNEYSEMPQTAAKVKEIKMP